MPARSVAARTRSDSKLDEDAEALYGALSDFIRAYQFRDRDRTYCHGLSVTQCYALEGVIRGAPLTLNELASHLFLDKSTVSRVVDALVEKRLVVRTPHVEDRRAVQLQPTANGRRLHRRVANEVRQGHKKLLEDVPRQTRGALIELVRRLAHLAQRRAGKPSAECSQP
ncbi:MAG: MarR family transcriptional regulator [Acidobacteriota bacterium]|nr:MAG: MarR family transcriptional regulator [Acidobacteriota bacterium]